MYLHHFHLFLYFFIIVTFTATVSSILNYSTSALRLGMTLPHDILSTLCTTCNREIQYVPVKSNTNGNQGRWLAKCLNRNLETGETCNTFRWLPNSRTPSLSPRLAAANQLPVSIVEPQSLTFAPTMDSQTVITLPKPTCLTMGCNST